MAAQPPSVPRPSGSGEPRGITLAPPASPSPLPHGRGTDVGYADVPRGCRRASLPAAAPRVLAAAKARLVEAKLGPVRAVGGVARGLAAAVAARPVATDEDVRPVVGVLASCARPTPRGCPSCRRRRPPSSTCASSRCGVALVELAWRGPRLGRRPLRERGLADLLHGLSSLQRSSTCSRRTDTRGAPRPRTRQSTRPRCTGACCGRSTTRQRRWPTASRAAWRLADWAPRSDRRRSPSPEPCSRDSRCGGGAGARGPRRPAPGARAGRPRRRRGRRGVRRADGGTGRSSAAATRKAPRAERAFSSGPCAPRPGRTARSRCTESMTRHAAVSLRVGDDAQRGGHLVGVVLLVLARAGRLLHARHGVSSSGDTRSAGVAVEQRLPPGVAAADDEERGCPA